MASVFTEPSSWDVITASLRPGKKSGVHSAVQPTATAVLDLLLPRWGREILENLTKWKHCVFLLLVSFRLENLIVMACFLAMTLNMAYMAMARINEAHGYSCYPPRGKFIQIWWPSQCRALVFGFSEVSAWHGVLLCSPIITAANTLLLIENKLHQSNSGKILVMLFTFI